MSTFRSFLESQYRSDPQKSARFLSDAVVLVRIRRRFWRGRRRMTDAKILADDSPVGEDATTTPSWKLCPTVLSREFEALGEQVETLVARYTLTHRGRGGTYEDEDEAGPALVGAGSYAVDAAVWPELRAQLAKLQEAYTTAADAWCVQDGYDRIHRELEEQLGEADYAKVKALVPKIGQLRRKFGLDVRRAPVRFVAADVSESQDELVDLAEMAVRVPREAAADGWENLASHLITASGVAVSPPSRTNPKTGATKPGTRKVNWTSVASAARVGATLLARGKRYVDRELAAAIAAIGQELSEDRGVAAAVAKKLNSDDAEAVRIGKMLTAAAALARSETGMCAGFQAARGV